MAELHCTLLSFKLFDWLFLEGPTRYRCTCVRVQCFMTIMSILELGPFFLFLIVYKDIRSLRVLFLVPFLCWDGGCVQSLVSGNSKK